MLSFAQGRSEVTFPEFTGERIYMLEFTQAAGLPDEAARWQPTVDQMLEGIVTDQPMFLMVDQSEVLTGNTQRRPGAHMDGYWHPARGAHAPVHRGQAVTGGYAPAHRFVAPGAHGPVGPGHGPVPPAPGTHGGSPGFHSALPSPAAGWDTAHLQEVWAPEAVILASSVSACRALVGEWDGPIGDGGDCAAADLSRLEEFGMDAGRAYAGNVTMVHESLPVTADALRTLVRLNTPGWSPELAAA
jgi:hypothetical protein